MRTVYRTFELVRKPQRDYLKQHRFHLKEPEGEGWHASSPFSDYNTLAEAEARLAAFFVERGEFYAREYVILPVYCP